MFLQKTIVVVVVFFLLPDRIHDINRTKNHSAAMSVCSTLLLALIPTFSSLAESVRCVIICVLDRKKRPKIHEGTEEKMAVIFAPGSYYFSMSYVFHCWPFIVNRTTIAPSFNITNVTLLGERPLAFLLVEFLHLKRASSVQQTKNGKHSDIRQSISPVSICYIKSH